MPVSLFYYGPLVKRLRQRPLTPLTWVRFPHGSPKNAPQLRLGSFFLCFRARNRTGRPPAGGKKQSCGLFFSPREIPRGRKLMWPGWLVGARVAGVSTAAFGSVRAGHARPAPGGEKGRVSGRGKVRRRGQDPSLRIEDSMAADAKREGRACPAPTGWLKESSRQQAGIPPALRRHLPLTREAGGRGRVKTPPYDVNPVNVQCKSNKNNRLLSRQQKSPVRFGILRA